MLKATQKEPAGSTLWLRLVVISTVPGLQEIEYGRSSSQKATLAPSGACCLSEAIRADAPAVGAETGNVCRRGWVSSRASSASVRPLVPQQLPLPALQLAPSLPPRRDSQVPMLLALLLFWGEREEGGVERSPAQKRRRESPACLDPWSTGEDGVRLARRQGWWLSVGWSKGGSILYPWIQGEALGVGLAHWGVPAAVDLLELLATHRQQQPLGRTERRDEQGAFLACPHESILTAFQETQSLQQSCLLNLDLLWVLSLPRGLEGFLPRTPGAPFTLMLCPLVSHPTFHWAELSPQKGS